MVNKLLIAPITEYCDWNQLWETKVAADDKEQTLLFSVWGKTEKQSRNNAENLYETLCKNPS